MFHTNTKEQGSDNDGNTLGASLFITTTSSIKYGRHWRRILYIGFFISRRKAPQDQQFLPPSQPSIPLPSTPLAAASECSEQLRRNLSTPPHCVIDISSAEENETVVQIVKEIDLYGLQKFGGFEQVALVLGSNLETGIQGNQNSHATEPVHTKGFLFFFLEASNKYHIFLLLISAAFSFTIEIMERGRKSGWHDGVAILVATFMLITFPSVVNFCRARKLEKKLLEKNRLKVKVIRSGQRQSIKISDLVVGDVVNLEKGDLVPADGLFVNGEGLQLDEALNSKIDCQQNPFLFFGSKVMEGEGSMLVTSVGADTLLVKVLSLVTRDPNKTLLEALIEKPHAYIDNLALSVSVLIALVALINFICRKHKGNDDILPELKGNVSVDSLMKLLERVLFKPTGRVRILISALTVVVIGIQHGMSLVIVISLSHWNEKAFLNQPKPENLLAGGTIGRATIICIDTTGGLICDQVEVNRFWIGEKDMINDEDCETDQVVLEALCRGIGFSVNLPEIFVSPTNDLLISWLKSRWGMDVEFSDQRFAILDYRKLSSTKKGRGILMSEDKDEGKILHLHWAGSASTILEMCSHYYDGRGEIHAMGDQKIKFQQMINDMEDSGLRSIALACRQTEVQEVREDGLKLLALVGLKYPCQEEIKLKVEDLRNAGVSIILISEDELSAVRAIACELGIFRPGSNDMAIEGEEIRDPTARMEKVEKMSVMGSCLSEDKLRLVQCLQEKGHVVAFFGGLTTSDTAALKEADVGIAEDSRSTEKIKESCDMIISDIGSLPPVLKLFRCAYQNIQKFTQLQLTACISGLLITSVATMVLMESPLTAIQLIWVNIVMCLLGCQMMMMELESQELINHKPAKRTESLVTQVMWKNIAFQVLYQAFVLLIFLFTGQVIPSMNEDVRKSMIFTSFTLCQVFNQLNVMNLGKKEVLVAVLGNFWFLFALGAVLTIQLMVVQFGKCLANFVRLNGVQWAVCFLFAALPLGLNVAMKLLLVSLSNWPPRSVGFHMGFPRRRPLAFFSYSGIPFSMFLFFSISYYFNPDQFSLA